MLGWAQHDIKVDRFKEDAIDYYEKEIQWFAFSFTMTFVHIRSTISAHDLYEIFEANKETSELTKDE